MAPARTADSARAKVAKAFCCLPSICQLLKRASRPSCGPGEGRGAFASVVTAQQGKFMSKSFKARWLGRGAQGWRCLPNNCPGASMSWDLIRVSPAAYRGPYFRAHHNGFFCGRGRCPKFVRSTGDRCDGEGSTAACNKAFPFALAQNAFSGLAAVFKALSLARVCTKAELWYPPSPWACAASHPPSHPPYRRSAPPLLLTASACLATLRPRALRGLPQYPGIQIQPKPI